MNCASCGALLEDGPFCPSCGARRPPGAAPPPDNWDPVGEKVSSLTVTVTATCSHCGEPVAVNGPAQAVHCPRCDAETPLHGLARALNAAWHGRGPGDASIHANRTSDPGPQCAACGKVVSIVAYRDRAGATATLSCPGCGAPIPTYPAPPWLKEQLPTALQVFGGDAGTNGAGANLRIDEHEAAPVAMTCPSCGGSLAITQDTARTLACTFCKASVFLPDDVWKRLHPVKTMLRWTLTYTGQLETNAEIERRERRRGAPEAQPSARQDFQARKAARRAMLAAGVNVDPKRFLPSSGVVSRVFKKLGPFGVAMIVIAGGFAVAPFVVEFHRHVHVTWPVTVTRSTGSSLRPGERCTVDADFYGSGHDENDAHVHLVCAGAQLFSSWSSVQSTDESVLWHITERREDRAPGNLVYGIDYDAFSSDQRYVSFKMDTKLGTAKLVTEEPAMEVDFSAPAQSDPRTGDAFFASNDP